MKIITFDDILQLDISPYECFEWVSNAIKEKKEALLPAKISLKPEIEGVFYNTMPVILPSINYGGVKLVTRYPKRNPSLDSEILLYDLKTGENVALMDGNWITTMRTGAVAAHSIRLLANPEFSVIGFIGLGNTARATLKVLLSVFPEKHFKVKLKKYKNQHELFQQVFSEYPNITFSYYDTIEEVIKGSEVVVSAATVFEEDVCSDDCFDEGILLVPIHTRGFTNCDLFFDKVFADDTNHVKGFKNFNQFKSFSEISDVVLNNVCGRESSKERILVYNIGIALHDMYFAGKIYEKMKECTEISLNAPTEKFWLE